MNFVLSTKPLADALNLGVINSNVSKFYQKSNVAQITATRNTLRINLEAARIVTELTLKGSGDSDETQTVLVDCMLLKQLVSTFEASTTTLEFTDGGLILHSGKSKFTLPKLLDDIEIEIRRPAIGEYGAGKEIDKAGWKFVKDYQMYAIAMSFIRAVYTRVWVGDTGDILVGDFDNGIFTHSEKGSLNSTCLLSDTIINLFISLPEGAKMTSLGRSYLINVNTDTFAMASEFEPYFEDDEGVGSYNSDIFLSTMQEPDNHEGAITVSTSTISKFLSQADLLATGTEATMDMTVADSQVILHDNNVDCRIDLKTAVATPFELTFKMSLLKSALSNYDVEEIRIYPSIQEDEVVGILICSDDLTTILAGVE